MISLNISVSRMMETQIGGGMKSAAYREGNADNMSYRVYLAGPITGLTFNGANDWREGFIEKMKDIGVDCANPLRGKDYLAGEKELFGSYEQFPMSSQKGIFGRDLHDVRNVDAVVVNLLGADRVSIGTVCEIAWTYPYEKYCLVVMEPGNVHTHPFINELASLVVNDLDMAALVIDRLSAPYR